MVEEENEGLRRGSRQVHGSRRRRRAAQLPVDNEGNDGSRVRVRSKGERGEGKKRDTT